LNCPRHPSKRVISSCKGCGTGFCIECVRETDQTTLCPDCYRRKVAGTRRQATSTAEPAAAPAARARGGEAAPSVEAERTTPEKVSPAGMAERSLEEEPVRAAGQVEVEEAGSDFLSQGPDEDFSQLTARRAIPRWKPRRKAPWREAVIPGAGAGRSREAPSRPEAPTAEGAGETREPAVPVREAAEGPPAAAPAASSEDALLQDVMSTLLSPEVQAPARPQAGLPERERPAARKAAPGPAERLRPVGAERATGKAEVGREATAEAAGLGAPAEVIPIPRKRRERARPRAEERAERWAFLSQPRVSEHTVLAGTWWKAALFVILMLFLGSFLWSVPNAYLVPRDTEYGIHSVLIGIILGLCFWWKAGKKHGTKLAVQASLTTLFALSLGEFLHWFLVVMKNSALRTIVFDLISFRFIWQNGAEIMRLTLDAMFPGAFLWVVLLPALVAFFIGFGMPPIPEIFFQLGRAVRE